VSDFVFWGIYGKPPDELLNPKIGEWMVCERGHRVAEVIKPLNSGINNWADCLGNWQCDEPVVGEEAANCRCRCQCGANFYTGHYIMTTEAYFRGNGYYWPKDNETA